MKRQIIHIDQEKCNGCGACAAACHEGAIAMIGGKATLMRDDYCDGMGDCLPHCPTGAITFEQREAAPYDEAAVLAAKQQLIDEAFAGAAQRLSSLPQAEYIDLLAALAAENGSGDEELLLSAKDREAVGPAVVKAANARKAGAAFRLSEETRETGGGLVLRRGRVELNCSFTEKLRQLRQEESSAVARLLFD